MKSNVIHWKKDRSITLHHAASRNFTEDSWLLLDEGPDTNLKNNEHQTVLEVTDWC